MLKQWQSAFISMLMNNKVEIVLAMARFMTLILELSFVKKRIVDL